MLELVYMFLLVGWPAGDFIFFVFNETATPDIYTLSLHDALPISNDGAGHADRGALLPQHPGHAVDSVGGDRKSTRLNSSHVSISYAVFCLKKKKQHTETNCHTSKRIYSIFSR